MFYVFHKFPQTFYPFIRDNNCIFIFDAYGFSIQDRTTGKILFRGLSRNGLYPFPSFNRSSSTFAFLGAKTTASIWHQRLGHPSPTILQNLAPSLSLQGASSSQFCESCQLAKSSKLPFSISESTTSKPLELIHSDVWGPAPLLSQSGFKYYVLFVDDFSRYTWLFPIHCKSEVFSVFLGFKVQIETMLSLKIKCLRSDGGGEYVNNNFKKLLHEWNCSSASLPSHT